MTAPKRKSQKVAARRAREAAIEDTYWTQAVLQAEAEARANGEKPIPFERIERELDAKRRARPR